MAIAQEHIEAQKKEIEKKEEALAQAKQSGYDIGVKEIKDALKAQVTRVCRGHSFQVWNEALNLAGMDASLNLRKTKNIFYPPALRIATLLASQETTTPKAPTTTQPAAKAPADVGTTKVISEPIKA